MDLIKKIYCRSFQKIMFAASYFLPWREPRLLKGEGKFAELPSYIRRLGIDRVLVVTDKGLTRLGLLDPLLAKFNETGIGFTVYDEVVPNPTIDNIEACVSLYRKNDCKGIIAVGGGSPIDCAKVTGARIVRPNKPVAKMKGLLKILHKLPLLIAVPTTAGTGSETTVAAVITDSATRHKYPINDTSLIPYTAVHDPLLTVGLPKHITSTTGMDALCHAVEAYIGKANTRKTKEAALTAVRLIHGNIVRAFEKGDDLEARANMQQASYLAGFAFTRAYVGVIHAVAHTLGGFYQVPHGLANAVIMPHVLKAYGKSAHRKLAELADAVGLGGASDDEKANAFIRLIEELNERMGIPATIPEIKMEDIDQLVRYADAEANPLYPTPKIMMKKDIREIYFKLMGSEVSNARRE